MNLDAINIRFCTSGGRTFAFYVRKSDGALIRVVEVLQ